jgi:small subunit ribosomal protein S3Ae
MVSIVINRAKELTFNELVADVVNGKVAAEVYKATKNIYPLRRVEVGKSEVVSKPPVLGSGTAAPAAAAPVSAPAPEEKAAPQAPEEQPKE